MNEIYSFLSEVFPSIVLTVAMFGLTSARFIGMMAVMPLFTRAGLDGTLRVGIAVGFSTPLTIEMLGQFSVNSPPPPLWILAFLIAKEVLVGLGLGIIFAVPLWAISMAGDVIDSYRNASASNTTDPVNSAEVSVLGTYLLILGLALFVAAGGVQVMIGATYRSLALWNVTSFAPAFHPDSLHLAGGVLREIGRLAFVVAGPLLVLMIVIDVAMMAITRMNTQFQVFEVSNSLKNLAMVLALPVYVAFFSEYMNVQWPKFFMTLDRILPGALPPVEP
jgi:type III secretion protein T